MNTSNLSQKLSNKSKFGPSLGPQSNKPTSISNDPPNLSASRDPETISQSPPGSSNSLVNNSHNTVQNFIISYGNVESTSALRRNAHHRQSTQATIEAISRSMGDISLHQSEESRRAGHASVMKETTRSRTMPSIAEDDNEDLNSHPHLESTTYIQTFPNESFRSEVGGKIGDPGAIPTHMSTRSMNWSSSSVQSQGATQMISLHKTCSKDIEMPEDTQKDIKAYMVAELKDIGPASEYTVRLWDPYPSLHADRKLQECHCTIGDVGSFRSDGGFEVKFNIFMTEETNREMGYDPPANFEPFALKNYEEIRPDLTTDYYTSDDFERKQKETGKSVFTFKSKTRPQYPGGIVLVLPEGCAKRMIRPRLIPCLAEYFNKRLDFWDDPLQFNDLVSGSLRLITTSYKSTIWGAATLRKSKFEQRSQPHLQAQLKRPGIEENIYEWDTHRNIKATRSPNEQVDDLLCTVAVEVYTLQYGVPIMSRVFSAMSPSSSRSSVASRSSIASTFRSSIKSTFSARRRS